MQRNYDSKEVTFILFHFLEGDSCFLRQIMLRQKDISWQDIVVFGGRKVELMVARLLKPLSSLFASSASSLFCISPVIFVCIILVIFVCIILVIFVCIFLVIFVCIILVSFVRIILVIFVFIILAIFFMTQSNYVTA